MLLWTNLVAYLKFGSEFSLQYLIADLVSSLFLVRV